MEKFNKTRIFCLHQGPENPNIVAEVGFKTSEGFPPVVKLLPVSPTPMTENSGRFPCGMRSVLPLFTGLGERGFFGINVAWVGRVLSRGICCGTLLFGAGMRADADGLWVNGYLPGYRQNGDGSVGFMNAQDFSRLTHLNHHSVLIDYDWELQTPTLDYAANGLTPVKQAAAVALAHSHGLPISLVVQAWVTQYRSAIDEQWKRTIIIDRLMSDLDTYGYDGVDVDLEPVLSPYQYGIQTENPNYIAFIEELHAALQTRTSVLLGRPPLLTAAMSGDAGPVFNILQGKMDQINLMTYDLSGPYPGWIVWHDSAVYDGGVPFPYSAASRVPSVHGEVQKCLNAGVSPSKLGVGISCDAFRWKGGTGVPETEGVTKPADRYTSNPSWIRFSYRDFKLNHFQQDKYHWDEVTKTSYLSIDNPGAADDSFWSFNDEAACAAKVDYVKNAGLGGVIIWELYEGYLPPMPEGERMPQLAAIFAAKTGTWGTPVRLLTARIQLVGDSDIRLTWEHLPERFQSYRVWRSLDPFNPLSGEWEDMGVVSQPPWEWDDPFVRTNPGSYFYRLQGLQAVPSP